MTVRDLRAKYLAFFESKGHSIYPSGSLVPYDVTGRLDESLLFNGAGMVQFKPFFRGVATPPNPRLTTAQRCVRTGDIESVGNLSHLTFFEMLGNFSFGDYFKREAIAYSWEFLTSPEWLALDPNRLSFTVFSDDDEAYAAWSEHVSRAGIDPSSRIFRLGEETNYWPAGAFSNGPPGPCGPNSEMFYWVADTPPPGAGYTTEDWLADDEAKNWLEIWNDVFIQYEWQGEELPGGGHRKTGMPNLPFQSIDTGMGLERTAAVLGGYASVYETDAFQPIIKALETISGRPYRESEATDIAIRIIADHMRTASFCVADGVLPANTGRGYVLRRLIRRAILKGQRQLGIADHFLARLVPAVVSALGDHYHDLVQKQSVIEAALDSEEGLFRRTLESGSQLLREYLQEHRQKLPGELAFRLYDTYGFPLEVTQELCAEAGVAVDLDGYRAAMAEAQERSRSADQRENVYGGVSISIITQLSERDPNVATPTVFRGYETTQCEAVIRGVRPVPGGEPGEFVVALDQTPFYAASGGQVADMGAIQGNDFVFDVRDVIRQENVIIHLVKLVTHGANEFRDHGHYADYLDSGRLDRDFFNQPVMASVATSLRVPTTRNHTATHLLHAALRETLGTHVTQAGSYVGPDRLRFDFTHGQAMTPDQIDAVETLVNEHVLAALPVITYTDVPIDEARKIGAMALFGEKYGQTVRVVQIGGMPPNEPSWSRELCGGIHVANTGQIGLFKILHEASAASGVRRIEAVTGHGTRHWLGEQQAILHEAAQKLKTNPKDLVSAIAKLQDDLRDERKKREKLASQGASAGSVAIAQIGGLEFAVESLDDAEAKDGQLVADRLVENSPNRVAFVSVLAEGKLTFVCKAGAQAVAAGAHAGNIVREAAKVAGGGGGGRPDFATAGGKDVSKRDEAVDAAKAALAAMLGA